jgi:conjugal transfer pilus assembly protein TraL
MNAAWKTEIPLRLDGVPRFLWWDFDVAIVFMGVTLLGIVTRHMLTFAAVGLALAWFYQRAKAGHHRAVLMHWMYWHLGTAFGMRRTPPSCIREFIG